LTLTAAAPASSIVDYKSTIFDKYGHLTSLFSQAPGAELDEAWHNQLLGKFLSAIQHIMDSE
jgi:hypothetical protein